MTSNYVNHDDMLGKHLEIKYASSDTIIFHEAYTKTYYCLELDPAWSVDYGQDGAVHVTGMVFTKMTMQDAMRWLNPQG